MNTNPLRSTAVVSSLTFLSRVLGFARDIVLAYVFGSNAQTDAFIVAFRVPNLLRRLFAEGAFALAFVPVLAEYRERRSAGELREFVDRVAGTLGLILFAVTLFGVVAAPILLFLFAPGFVDNPDQYQLSADMLRLTFPYILFISLVAFAGGILNSYGNFAVPALTPVLLNIALILAAVVLAPHLERPITALAWGVLLAGIVQLLFQLPFLRTLRLLPRPRWGWRNAGVKKIIKLMIPTLFGASVAQVHLLVNTVLASTLISGSVSWLYYTDRLVEFPLGVFGVALATVILPRLSRQHIASSSEGFAETLDWALRWVLLIALPATLGLMILAGPLIATFFFHGAFDAQAVVMTERSLIAYSFGLTAFMLVKVLAPGFFARQDTRTPVKIGIKSMLVGMLLSVVLMTQLAHAGLALATALAGFLNAGLLYRALLKQGVYRPRRGWAAFLVRLLLANVCMGAVLWVLAGDLDAWLNYQTAERVWRSAGLVGAGVFIYAGALLVCGLRPRHLRAPE